MCVAARRAPGFWQAATQADFLRGDVEHLSIDEHGRLMLGPEVTRIHDPGVPFVWTVLPAADGAMFLGTGNDGKVIRVDRSGKGTVFYDSGEMEVHALAAAPAGALYVGTSPDGRIYKVDAKGQATTVLRSGRQVHLVARRRSQGRRVRGDRRQGHRLSDYAGRQGREVFRDQGHARRVAGVRCEQPAAGRHRIARTRVPRRHRGQGLPAARHDLSGSSRPPRRSQRRDLRRGAERPLVGGGSDDRSDPAPPPPVAPTIPNVSTEITSFAIIDAQASGQTTATSGGSAGRGPTGAVYRVQPDGLWDEVWESQDDAPYDVAIEPDGALLVATGAKGKIFRLSGDPVRAVLLTRVSAQQATLIARANDRTYVVTANPGLLMALSPARAARGTYESDVKDARMVSTWGVIGWRASAPAGTNVEVFRRSGNTRTPDEAWSDWSGPYANADGSPITSPKARYLQWRAVLTGQVGEPGADLGDRGLSAAQHPARR